MCPYFFVTRFSRVQINDVFCHHVLYELLSDKPIQINIDPYFFWNIKSLPDMDNHHLIFVHC